MTARTNEDCLVACDLAEVDGTLGRLTAVQAERLDKARAALMAGDHGSVHAISLILDRTIAIPVYRWAQVQLEFARLAAKAEERGLPVPALTEVSRTDTHVVAHVLGGAPVFRGWRLVADLESIANKKTGVRSNIVRTANGETCPDRYRQAPERCEHCNVSRLRNRTFVIANESGEMVQVGSTCLDEYLGTDALAAWLTIGALRDAADGWGADAWDEGEFARYRGHASVWGLPIPALTFLAAVSAEVRGSGYTSAKVIDNPDLATGRSVWAAAQETEHEPVTDADLAHARALLEFGLELDDRGDFAHNIRTILGAGEVRWADANMIAALHPMHAAECARVSEHLPGAEVDDKVFGDWTVRYVTSYFNELYLVWRYTVRFTDEAGREIVWRTTAPCCKTFAAIEDYNERLDAVAQHGGTGTVQAGTTYRVIATVKTLGEYNGVAQTEVTRASAYLPGTEPKSMHATVRKAAKVRGVEVPEWAMTAAARKRAAKG